MAGPVHGAETGLSQSSVSRIWRAFGLKPHVAELWKLSTDPDFIGKVRDVVGLYMAPPENALVLCVDEKSQIQALDRTAPCLPLLPTTPARVTHDYVRQEFLRFLKLIDAAVPSGLELHLVLDNYATHKTPAIHQWLLKHPRFHLHFTPTSSSWMNLVERWFAELTNRKLRRSAHRSVTELETDIRKWINEWNKNPKPFVWTKTADRTLGDELGADAVDEQLQPVGEAIGRVGGDRRGHGLVEVGAAAVEEPGRLGLPAAVGGQFGLGLFLDAVAEHVVEQGEGDPASPFDRDASRTHDLD